MTFTVCRALNYEESVSLASVKRSSQRQTQKNDAPLVEFVYLVFTRIPSESYRRRLGALLCWLTSFEG